MGHFCISPANHIQSEEETTWSTIIQSPLTEGKVCCRHRLLSFDWGRGRDPSAATRVLKNCWPWMPLLNIPVPIAFMAVPGHLCGWATWQATSRNTCSTSYIVCIAQSRSPHLSTSSSIATTPNNACQTASIFTQRTATWSPVLPGIGEAMLPSP